MRQLNHLLRSLTLLVLAPSLFAGMLLTGCAVKTTSAPEVSLTFMNRPAIHLNVGKIQVVNRYQMPLKPPLVEHLMPVAPGAGVERWAMDILRAVGSGNTAVLTIHDASVTEISLQQKPGLKALLTLDQAQRYDARLRATLEIRDVNGQQTSPLINAPRSGSKWSKACSLILRPRWNCKSAKTLARSCVNQEYVRAVASGHEGQHPGNIKNSLRLEGDRFVISQSGAWIKRVAIGFGVIVEPDR
jgi:hypothetical protein